MASKPGTKRIAQMRNDRQGRRPRPVNKPRSTTARVTDWQASKSSSTPKARKPTKLFAPTHRGLRSGERGGIGANRRGSLRTSANSARPRRWKRKPSISNVPARTLMIGFRMWRARIRKPATIHGSDRARVSPRTDAIKPDRTNCASQARSLSASVAPVPRPQPRFAYSVVPARPVPTRRCRTAKWHPPSAATDAHTPRLLQHSACPGSAPAGFAHHDAAVHPA